MKTHAYLTIDENGTGLATQEVPQFEETYDAGTLIFDDGHHVAVVGADAVRKLFKGRVPEAPHDKFPNGRTFIVNLEELR